MRLAAREPKLAETLYNQALDLLKTAIKTDEYYWKAHFDLGWLLRYHSLDMPSSETHFGDVSLCVPTPKGYDASGIDPLAGTDHPIWESRRLWSLWEMINFTLGPFWWALKALKGDIDYGALFAPNPGTPVSGDDLKRIKLNVDHATKDCVAALHLTNARRVLVKLDDFFNQLGYFSPQTWERLRPLLQELCEVIEEEVQHEFFFHYPREMAKLYFAIDSEWSPIVAAFPSSRREIETGTDCYALGDHSGCVFHMMRIAELGLRTIARERGVKSLGKKKPKPIEWGTWQEVFDAIEAQLRVVRHANLGPKRDVALSFYDIALSDLRTLRGLYRDPAMHFRETYDKGEAYSAMFRVQSLMRTLSTKLREDRIRKIVWGL